MKSRLSTPRYTERFQIEGSARAAIGRAVDFAQACGCCVVLDSQIGPFFIDAGSSAAEVLAAYRREAFSSIDLWAKGVRR